MVYLFLYNRSYGDAEEVRERLNGLDVIDEIRELFPYSFFLSSDEDANTIIRYAEHALYNAKKRGKNKIVQFSQLNLGEG